jgi:hypothetical protein
MTTSEDTNAERSETIVLDPEILGGMPDLAVAYDKANPLQDQTRRLSPWPSATLVKSGQIPRRKG